MSLMAALTLAAAPITAAPPAPTPVSAPVSEPAVPRDTSRVALIERVSRSVVRVKGVREVAEPAYPADMGRPQNAKIKRKDTSFLERMSALPVKRPIHEEGTAFVYDSARGLLLTAAHIVDEASVVTIFLADGSTRAAALVGADRDIGIAVLRVEGGLPPMLPLATRTPKIGETMTIVGRLLPFDSIGATQGMVIGEARGDSRGGEAILALVDYIMLDNLLPLGGMGGGPVVDLRGEVIGIVSAIWGRGYGQEAATMAVPLAGLRSQIEEIARTGKVVRSHIGLNLMCDDSICRIGYLVPGGPADSAGLKPDDILVSVDGIKTASANQLRRQIAQLPPGSDISALVRRGDAQLNLKVRTADQPAPTGEKEAFTAPGPL